MTTKPRARKFRIRRSGEAGAAPTPGAAARARHAAATGATGEANPLDSGHDDGLGSRPFPTAASAASTAAGGAGRGSERGAAHLSTPAEMSAEAEIDAIRREGLTGRQLRMARRVAQRHGLSPVSDFDAVRLLRRQGIDPFERSNMLELVVPGRGAEAEAEPKLPQTVKPAPVPSTEVLAEDQRAAEIMRMQRDIVRRRRRKIAQLVTRLFFFVVLPTIIAGYYYFAIATPMYETNTEFVIQKADSPGASQLGGLFRGTGFATSQDSITVQGYLQSRDAMLRLDQDMNFRRHFSDPAIDPLQRLDPNASMEDAYRLYRRVVKVGYDPTEGVVKMRVIAPDPQLSVAFSEKLIEYAEEQVDKLTQRLREDQMRGAREAFKEAEAKMIAAQKKVQELQEKLGVFDPAAESGALLSQITAFETQLHQKRLELQQLLDNPRPNQARVDGVKGDIRRLEALVAELRAQMTDSGADSASLAQVTGQLRLAETELQTRQLMMTQALQQLEAARMEANRQTRFLSMGVRPVAPDEATYPRALENTVLALVVFAGIYLMLSLTASVLREQVSG
ncbi:MAG: capsule biosynthesis protein [Alphaproteobacteria bacterium]|nr:MAG: capsule biosynthesis protein [Alphaproteobacteria bacterium]